MWGVSPRSLSTHVVLLLPRAWLLLLATAQLAAQQRLTGQLSSDRDIQQEKLRVAVRLARVCLLICSSTTSVLVPFILLHLVQFIATVSIGCAAPYITVYRVPFLFPSTITLCAWWLAVLSRVLAPHGLPQEKQLKRWQADGGHAAEAADAEEGGDDAEAVER